MLNSATLFSMALFFAGLLLWLAMMRIGHYRAGLVQAIGPQRIDTMLRVLIITPLVIALITAVIIVLVNGTSDPLLLARLAHLGLVLGAWMAGILGVFFFLFPYRLKLDFPLPALLTSLLAIPTAIYLTPFTRFSQIYLPDSQVGLGAAAGLFLIILTELILILFRRSL